MPSDVPWGFDPSAAGGETKPKKAEPGIVRSSSRMSRSMSLRDRRRPVGEAWNAIKPVEAEGEGTSASVSPREAFKPVFKPVFTPTRQAPRWESCRELRLKKEDIATSDIGGGAKGEGDGKGVGGVDGGIGKAGSGGKGLGIDRKSPSGRTGDIGIGKANSGQSDPVKVIATKKVATGIERKPASTSTAPDTTQPDVHIPLIKAFDDVVTDIVEVRDEQPVVKPRRSERILKSLIGSKKESASGSSPASVDDKEAGRTLSTAHNGPSPLKDRLRSRADSNRDGKARRVTKKFGKWPACPDRAPSTGGSSVGGSAACSEGVMSPVSDFDAAGSSSFLSRARWRADVPKKDSAASGKRKGKCSWRSKSRKGRKEEEDDEGEMSADEDVVVVDEEEVKSMLRDDFIDFQARLGKKKSRFRVRGLRGRDDSD